MLIETYASGGLLRFPRFIRDFVSVIVSEQGRRSEGDGVSLVNPDVRVSDFWVALGITVIFLFLRMYLQATILSRLFRRYGRSKVPKLCENLIYSVYYVCAFSLYVFVVRPNVGYTYDLLSNKSHVVGDLLSPFPPKMSGYERFYYSQAFGFYISGLIFTVFLDTRHSDLYEMVIHHVSTIVLIVMSYLYGYIRVGVIVIALHDVGDIFLYSSKLFHHMGVKGVDILLFVCFAITFYITRLVMFSRIVHTITVETLQTVLEEAGFNNWAKFYDTYLMHYVVFVVLLCTLLILHCFWYSLVIRLIINEVVYGVKIADEGDPRSDDEEDGEEEDDDDDDDEEEEEEGDSNNEKERIKKTK